MKRKVLSLVFVVFLSNFIAIGQQVKVNIFARQQPLAKVLHAIAEQTGYYFSYSPDQIDTTEQITLIARSLPLQAVLDNLADKLGFQYKIIQRQIILKPLPAVGSEHKPALFTIAGFVVDSNNQAVIGANIYLDGRLRGFTNEDGFFSVKTSAAEHWLKVSFIGYKTYVQRLKVNGNLKLNIVLIPSTEQLDVIVVTPSDKASVDDNGLNFVQYNSMLIERNPGLGGSNDVLKGLRAIPGFNFYGDGSLIFHVRGGLKSQNYILIDDAPIFNPVHLLGFFSAISPYAVNSIRIYKNYLPARFAGRTSSIIDIRIKEGNLRHWQLDASLNPLIRAMVVSGPLKREKVALLLSLRRSYIKWAFENRNSQINTDFTDIHAKVSWHKDKNNRFYLSLFGSNDQLGLARNFLASSIKWYNIASSLRWVHTFSPNLFMNARAYYGRYSYFLHFVPDTTDIFNSLIVNSGVKTDFYYTALDRLPMHLGFNFSYFYFNPANINQYAYLPSQNALEANSYVAANYHFSSALHLKVGLALRYWANLGPTYLYRYSPNHYFLGIDTIGFRIFNHFVYLEPRVSLNFRLRPKLFGQLAAGHYVQYLQLLSNSISPFTTVEAWMPANPNIPPLTTTQVSAGLSYKTQKLEASAEIYWKRNDNVVAFSNFATLLFNPYIEGILRYGRVYSYGLELKLEQVLGRFNYWITYTYSKTQMQIPELWQDIRFPTSYDKPHNFYANFVYNFDRLKAGFTVIFSSGNRFTAPIGYYQVLDHIVPLYGLPNNAVMPFYARADCFFKWRINRNPAAKVQHFLSFSVYNITGRKNAVLVNFNKVRAGDNFFYVPGNYIYEYQITPSFYYLLRTVPMLTYYIQIR